ncbi:hypothetical protein [Amycolatopsis alkalitolerans]|uniref:Uncharacterized protein n=1 Tax=Amycolatopsis alkalitolerans TaxID=2547244 RepID=A0A5C4LW88_9PSEU|nr:hypothetical protein [Amycolatopsis alkalitolerans]TNC23702.1 hypothetical protein FG385_20270 [Amycolatopsis alkalitolerans]
MTGVIRQDDALVDVIGDAIGEAKADGGEVPEWGARTLARALANERDDPMSGALHHFAITGRADREAIAKELAELYQRTTDEEIREWINWLGMYVINLPDTAGTSGDATTPDDTLDEDALNDMVERLRSTCAEADAQGAPISTDDAKVIAGLLAHLLPPGSEMSRFAATGAANPVVIAEECEFIRERTLGAPDISTWALSLAHYLAANASLGRQAGQPALDAGDLPNDLLIRYGITRHGDAFRAYLSLPAIDPARTDLIKSFLDFYVGTYDSMDDLTTDLVGGTHSEAELLELARDDISFEELVRAGWDIVELDGKFYVFTK